MSPEQRDELIERACEIMHDAYEAAAIEAGWETQERSRVPWVGVPEANKATMRAAVNALVGSDLGDGRLLAIVEPDPQSAVGHLIDAATDALMRTALMDDDVADDLALALDGALGTPDLYRLVSPDHGETDG